MQVLSLAVNNHFDPSRTEGPHGISQPVSSSTSDSQIPRHPAQPCAQPCVQLCACILKKGLHQLLCVPYTGSRAGEGWGEAPTLQHSLLPLYQGLGCFLLIYLSFPGAANFSLHKNTPSRSICSDSLTGNPSMLLLFTCFASSLTAVGPNKPIPYRFCTNVPKA